MRSAMLSRAPRRPLLRLLLLLLLSAAALARPALPEDELAVLEEDLEEDLEDLEDARAVDAAYARLFPPAAEAAEPPAPLGPAPEDSLTAAAGLGALADYDYQGDQPQPDAEDRPSRPGTTDNLTLATTASPTAADVTGGEATPSTAADDDGPHGSVASRTAERERDRELRLHHIKNQVLSYLGLSQNSGHPNVSALSASEQQLSLLRVVGRIGLPNLPPQDIFAEKTLSHYPSCSLPRNTDETLWSGGSAMHLLFDLPNHPPPAGTSVNIVQATLRLFKLSQGNATKAGGEGPICLPSTAAAGDEDGSASDAPLPETTLEGGGAEAEAGPVPLHALLGMATTDDRQVRVSVYWYTRSLKKNKNGVVVEKRKLLDSRMLPVHGSAWTEWNVRTAVKVWRDSGRNFGLVVEVEDEDGTLLDAHQFFNGMNCTQEPPLDPSRASSSTASTAATPPAPAGPALTLRPRPPERTPTLLTRTCSP